MRVLNTFLICSATIALIAYSFADGQTLTRSNSESSQTPAKAVMINPKIDGYGAVVKLPNAAQQPKSGSKIVVDLTAGGDPAEVNSAFDKVCRFVNLYAGAGKEPADVEIAVVIHGDATLTVLNEQAYASRFKTSSNPNIDCFEKLKKAGVEIYVCGQALYGKGAQPEEVGEYAKVAVSALTALVNLQADGYAYIPL